MRPKDTLLRFEPSVKPFQNTQDREDSKGSAAVLYQKQPFRQDLRLLFGFIAIKVEIESIR